MQSLDAHQFILYFSPAITLIPFGSCAHRTYPQSPHRNTAGASIRRAKGEGRYDRFGRALPGFPL
jgi:hypothetical protein